MLENIFKNKKVFISGGTGFIGPHLVTRLRACGAEVEVCSVDLLKSTLTESVLEHPDYIYHLAAVSPGATDTVDSEQLVQNNRTMSAKILDFAQSSKAKIIVASSSHVYPLRTGSGWSPFSENEIIPGQALSAFGLSKQAAEQISCEYAKRKGVQVVVARVANVYGPGDVSHRFVPTFIRKCLNKQFPLTVLGNRETLRDFVYIDDAVNGLLLAGGVSNYPSIINIGSNEAVSLATVAENIKQALGLDSQEIVYPYENESEVSYNVLNSHQAALDVGYYPATSLHEGVRKTVAWWLTQQHSIL